MSKTEEVDPRENKCDSSTKDFFFFLFFNFYRGSYLNYFCSIFITKMRPCGYVHLRLLLLICLISGVTSTTSNETETHLHEHGQSSVTGIPIVTLKYHHVETPFLIALWVLVVFLAKLGMYQTFGGKNKDD